MNGASLIAVERLRQIEQEGWTNEHDDQHDCGELANAAVCYASPLPVFNMADYNAEVHFTDPWPDNWDPEWDKRSYDKRGRLVSNRELPTGQRIRNLVKAGALIAAEIDRLRRMEHAGKQTEGL